jgi:Mg-chelatase subunit ChlD
MALVLAAGLPAAGPARAQGGAPGPAVTYQDLLKLLGRGVPEQDVRKRLEGSPTQFTLDAEQVRELKAAGASDELLRFLQQRRITMSSDVQDYALILDCSGSMADKTPDGVTKMEAAKKVVTDLIRHLPSRKRLTFLVYGHNVEDGCDAVKVVCARKELDDDLRQALARVIAPLKPLGHTPIAKALRTAGQELAGAEGLCEVVLITDGMETCHGDPADEARKLTRSLKLLGGVNVIGFDVEPREKEAVRHISEAGQGKYYDARTAEELRKRVEELEEQRRLALERARRDAEERAAVRKQGGPAAPPEPRAANPPRGGDGTLARAEHETGLIVEVLEVRPDKNEMLFIRWRYRNPTESPVQLIAATPRFGGTESPPNTAGKFLAAVYYVEGKVETDQALRHSVVRQAGTGLPFAKDLGRAAVVIRPNQKFEVWAKFTLPHARTEKAITFHVMGTPPLEDVPIQAGKE